MSAEKTVGISFRINPQHKQQLVAAAARERRSLTNMLEVLIDDYCMKNGISTSSAQDTEEREPGSTHE